MSFSGSTLNIRSFGGLSGPPPSNNYASGSRVKTSPPRTTPDLPALQDASRLVQEQLIKDTQIIPDLGDMLTIRALFRLGFSYGLVSFSFHYSWWPVIRILHDFPRRFSRSVQETEAR